MIDPALIDSLRPPMPPELPAIVQERAWQSRAWQSAEGQRAERLARRLADGFDAAADAWLAQMERAKSVAEGAVLEVPGSPEGQRDLTRAIEDFEALADLRAYRTLKLDRRIRRDVKAAFKVDPSVAAAKRQLGERLVATEKRVVDGLLAYALFLRAVRAEADPQGRGGPTFDDPDELERYLAALPA